MRRSQDVGTGSKHGTTLFYYPNRWVDAGPPEKRMAADSKDVSQSNQSQGVVQIGDFKTITLPGVKVDTKSTDPGDFVELLNTVSPLLGGLTNLGVFCDITSVTQKSALLADVEMQYIHVETEEDEQPNRKLVNDGSSVNPSDLSYELLLK